MDQLWRDASGYTLWIVEQPGGNSRLFQLIREQHTTGDPT